MGYASYRVRGGGGGLEYITRVKSDAGRHWRRANRTQVEAINQRLEHDNERGAARQRWWKRTLTFFVNARAANPLETDPVAKEISR